MTRAKTAPAGTPLSPLPASTLTTVPDKSDGFSCAIVGKPSPVSARTVKTAVNVLMGVSVIGVR